MNRNLFAPRGLDQFRRSKPLAFDPFFRRGGGGFVNGTCRGVFLTTFLLCFFTAAQAGVIASSTFDSNAEGWLVGDYLSSSGTSSPTHVAAGGNPGGFIRTTDLYGWTAYRAPASFQGNWVSLGAVSLQWDIYILNADAIPYSAVILSNGVLSIEYFLGNPSVNEWNTFNVPLTSAAGWTYANGYGTGGAVSAPDFAAVLGNVTALRLNADWLTGDDRVDLDNVFLRSRESPGGVIPEPSSLALLGTGILALGLVRRRK